MPRLLILLATLLVGCAATPGPATDVLTGNLTAENAPTLPPTARLHLALVPLQATGSESAPVAQSSVPVSGTWPIPFRLPYDAARIDPATDYRLIAQITVHGSMWFSNILTPARVLAPGAATADLTVPLRPDGVMR